MYKKNGFLTWRQIQQCFQREIETIYVKTEWKWRFSIAYWNIQTCNRLQTIYSQCKYWIIHPHLFLNFLPKTISIRVRLNIFKKCVCLNRWDFYWFRLKRRVFSTGIREKGPFFKVWCDHGRTLCFDWECLYVWLPYRYKDMYVFIVTAWSLL